VAFYEGEQGVERMVRTEHSNGFVVHYEGEGGAERRVRMVHAEGECIALYGA